MRRLPTALMFVLLVGCQSGVAAPAASSGVQATSGALSSSPSPSPAAVALTVDQVVAASFAAMQKVASVRYTVTADGKVLAVNPVYRVRDEFKVRAPDKGSVDRFEQGSFVGNVYQPNRSQMVHQVWIGLQQWGHTDLVDSKGTVLEAAPWKPVVKRIPSPFPSVTFGRVTTAEVMAGSDVNNVSGPTLEATETRNGVRAYRVSLSAMRNNGLVGGLGPANSAGIPGPTLYAASAVTVWIDSITMLWQRVERIDRNLTDPTIFIDQITDYFDYDKTAVSAPPGL